MKIIQSIFLSVLSVCLYTSCSEEVLKPIDDSQAAAPEKVFNVQVENLSGEVKISYSVPKGPSLLYVEAECEMAEGRISRTKSSYYNNSLNIAGFGDSKEYEVKLYSVGRNLKRSEPVIIKVTPLDPPIWNIYESLEVVEDFGGLSIDFKNQTEADVSVVVERLDSTNNWITAETFYTNLKEGKLAVRGLEAKKQPFRIFVNDRWGNQSEVLNVELIPLYEEELNYANFKEHKMPNDPAPFGANRVHFLWNDNLTGSASGSGGWYRTANGSGVPNQITIDMGVTAKLSRIKLWQRGSISETNLLYSAGSPRDFEIWGSNNPNPDGTYDSWTKMMDCELVKPSGQAPGTNSEADLEAAVNGHEFILPLSAPAVRYIRIRVVKTYGVTNYFWMSEINFYGQPK